MSGIEGTRLRSAFIVESVAGTTPATPGFRVMHQPALFKDGIDRLHQTSLVASGAFIGDALMDRSAVGSIPESPVVYGIYDQQFESLLRSSWSSDAMTNAQDRAQTFTHELTIPAGQGGTLTYLRYRGVEVTGATIKVVKEKEILIGFDLMGLQSIDSLSAAITGATYTNPTNNDPFSAMSDFRTFTIGGYDFDDLMEATIDLKYEDVIPQGKLGDSSLSGIARTGFKPSIKCKFYVDTNFAILRDLVRATTQNKFKITFNFGSLTQKKYRMEFWDCYADMAPIDFAQPSPFMEVTFTPVWSQANNGVLTMTRGLA
jgi:hypothetical protein